ncbi:11752_t:CDS:2, partial [Racocetra fulgida]
SQRHSPYPASPRNNTNINNPGMRNSEQNISVPPPPIETLSPQPPPYSRATDEAQNNNQSQDSSNHEVAVSGSNLTPDLLNLSLSRNESDVIMHDIGTGQHLIVGTNNPPINLDNILANPGRSYQHTVGGVRLELVFNESGGSGFQENA